MGVEKAPVRQRKAAKPNHFAQAWTGSISLESQKGNSLTCLEVLPGLEPKTSFMQSSAEKWQTSEETQEMPTWAATACQ